MRAVVATSLGFAFLLSVYQPAQADEQFGFVQITCAPEVSYISIQRFTIEDIPQEGRYLTHGFVNPASDAALHSKYSIYDEAALEAHPYDCKIPAIPGPYGSGAETPGYEVRVVGEFSNPQDSTDYMHIQDEVEIFLNGKSIARMGLNPYGLGTGPDTIEISPNGVWSAPKLTVTTCMISDPTPDSYVGDKHLTCRDQSVAPN